jgi:DNA-binding CsgD family transcriptional regulator
MRWRSYAVGPIVVEGETIGLLHADPGERPAGAFDLELITIACDGLGEVFDRATLRDTLQRHRTELQSAAQWIGGRLGSIAADGQLGTAAAGSSHDGDAVSTLTARELEVLALMARGQTNAAIARALVVQEGTVKYHVKNVLRKMGARSRADAVARYVRATS